MKFPDTTVFLENEMVLLRPLEESDYLSLLHFAQTEPELWTYSLQSGAGEENFRLYFDAALEAKKANLAYPFVVIDKLSNKVAGSTRFYDFQLAHQALSLGYTWYGKEFQGSLLNKNCKFLLLQYAFETMGAERLEFRADNKNLRSIAAMKSIGCQVEGVLRNNCSAPNGRRDSIVLSILKDEWEKKVKTLILDKISIGNG